MATSLEKWVRQLEAEMLRVERERDIVGWNLASHLKEPLVLAALRQAIRARQPRPGLVHQTDRGDQYAGRVKSQLNFGRTGNCSVQKLPII